MNLKAKLFVCNLLLAVIVLIVGVTGILYVYYSVQNESVTITGDTLTNVRLIMTKAKTDANDIQSTIDESEDHLSQVGLKSFYYDLNGTLVHTNSTEKRERRLADKHYADSSEIVMSVEGGTVMFVCGTSSGYIVAVNSSADVAKKARTFAIVFVIAVCLAGGLMFAAVFLAEKVMIFPRLLALKEAMRQIYLGNYEQVMKVEKKKKPDELSGLIAEFEMMRVKIADAEKQREAFDRERGTMISGISHDLRTPLSIIQGHAKGLKDGVARRMNKETEYVNKIYETAVSMNELISKLSNFAKMQSRDVMYKFVDHDICDVVKQYVNINYIQYATRGLNVKAVIPSNTKLIVSLDVEQFKRVLQNVCENSLKYKEKSTANLNIKVIDEGDNVVITLADDGPGINDFEVDYIFESYYRGDQARSNPIAGSGLGLSVVKSVVSAHHGEVSAYNDKGLTIKIKLPIRRRR